MIDKAVILAAGSATRMQENIENYIKNGEELKAVKKGEKMAVRFERFPFLDYQMINLIQAGIKNVNIVLKPDDEYFIKHYTGIGKKVFPELKISFSSQNTPDGTAHAVLSARDFVKESRFIVLNGDNLYPIESLKMLVNSPENFSAVAGFDLDGFNPHTKSKIKSFAVLTTKEGKLDRIIEKPERPEVFIVNDSLYTLKNHRILIKNKLLVSMNLWAFTPDIMDACSNVKRHAPRKPDKPGEYELPDAAMLMKNNGREILVYYVNSDVLDLTKAEDITIVASEIKNKLKNLIEELEKRYSGIKR